MNLELLKEIEELRLYKKSYTEIADITGLTKASIVLSLRLKSIYEIFYQDKLLSLNNEIIQLNSSIDTLKESLIKKEREIEQLNSLVNIDSKNNMIISFNEYKKLQENLTKYANQISSLEDKLQTKEEYFYNLSFIEKLHLLFN
jgi:hypothetical protein